MFKKFLLGAAVALSALPVLAQSELNASAKSVRRAGGSDASVWSEDSDPAWKSAVSSDSQAAANARMAEKLRMNRQSSAVRPVSHLMAQEQPIADAACGSGC